MTLRLKFRVFNPLQIESIWCRVLSVYVGESLFTQQNYEQCEIVYI